jgi:hypothetical protein
MFDPALNLSSLLNMLWGIVGTAITAFLWPFLTLVVGPVQSIAYWLSGGG